MKVKLSIVVLTLSAALAGASCGAKREAGAEAPPAVAAGVRVEAVRASAVEDYYEAAGTVRAKQTSVVASKVMGSIVSMSVGEGDFVRAGQTLAEIDDRDARAQTRKARAGVREAQESADEVDKNIRAAESARDAAEASQKLAAATFRRYENLLGRGSVSRQEFEEARARHEVAEAEVRRAERMLQSMQARRRLVLARVDQARADVASAEVQAGYARITSPVSGVVVAKHADLGHMAAPGSPLVTVESAAGYQLEVAVEESRVGRIKLGDAAVVRIEALGPRELHGAVEEIVPAADPASRSYSVRVRLNPGELAGLPPIRSGLYGKARFPSGQRQVVTLPQDAVVRRGQLVGVYAVDEAGVARLRLIQTGKTWGDRVEVLSGLSEGERVVVEGAGAVSDGVRVQAPAPAAASSSGG
jgi:membrane fusion protein, multidrug efflux system